MATLLYFGKLQDIIGKTSERMDLPNTIANTDDLRAFLDDRMALPEILVSKTVRVAINSELVADPYPISNSDEIAFLPPVGGG